MRIAAFKEPFVRVPNTRSCASGPFPLPATLMHSQGFIITTNYSSGCLGIKKTWSREDETGGANVTCRYNLCNDTSTGLTNLMSGALKLTSRHLVSTNVDRPMCSGLVVTLFSRTTNYSKNQTPNSIRNKIKEVELNN